MVEDKDGVRSLADRELERLGCTVLETRGRDKALLMCRRHNGSINLLPTDIVMPQMGDKELAEGLRGLRPDAGVLYVDETMVRRVVRDEGAPLLQKPYTQEALALSAQGIRPGDVRLYGVTHLLHRKPFGDQDGRGGVHGTTIPRGRNEQ